MLDADEKPVSVVLMSVTDVVFVNTETSTAGVTLIEESKDSVGEVIDGEGTLVVATVPRPRPLPLVVCDEAIKMKTTVKNYLLNNNKHIFI